MLGLFSLCFRVFCEFFFCCGSRDSAEVFRGDFRCVLLHDAHNEIVAWLGLFWSSWAWGCGLNVFQALELHGVEGSFQWCACTSSSIVFAGVSSVEVDVSSPVESHHCFWLY
jgi:hypothetical protein